MLAWLLGLPRSIKRLISVFADVFFLVCSLLAAYVLTQHEEQTAIAEIAIYIFFILILFYNQKRTFRFIPMLRVEGVCRLSLPGSGSTFSSSETRKRFLPTADTEADCILLPSHFVGSCQVSDTSRSLRKLCE